MNSLYDLLTKIHDDVKQEVAAEGLDFTKWEQ